ncbi:MAG: M20/M25/M40 family metallo-hydrolase [Planctomycetes bacterium]|nr:M20/M25/M40 family metallo-hydrolase [Planctomycetota bacterium]
MQSRAGLPLLLLPTLLFAQETPAPKTPAAVPAIANPIDEATAAAIRMEGIEKSQAMRLLGDLCGKVGHRLTGSDNFTKACNWAVDEFKAMGLSNVHLEKWGEWKLVWNRGAWTGRVVHPIQLDMYVATEAWTAGTNGLQRGPLVPAPKSVEDVESLKSQLKGAFVYYSRKPNNAVRDACEGLGILGWVYRAGDPDAKYPTRVRVFGNHMTAQRTLEDLPKLPEIAVRADDADKLRDLLEKGEAPICEFDIQNSFREGPIELHNVIAEIPGTKKPDEVVVVCGHLDSWHQAQGTTDNGTGATSTMEAARILAAVGAKPERTIRFCLWGGEEEGLLGSKAYVQRHRTEMDKISAVYNHDTGTNWAYSLGVTEGMFGPLSAVFANVMPLTAPDEDHDGPVFRLSKANRVAGGGGSDHASFIAAGVPAWSWGLKGRSDYFQYTWHTQWDKIDVAIPEYQRHTCTVIAMAALGTANLPELLDRSGVARGGEGRQAGSYAAALFDGEMDGFKFTKVNAGGRADKMGVKEGDLLQKVNGQEIEQMFQIFQIARESEGDDVTFTFKRGDQTFDGKMKKDDLPARRRGGGGGEQGGNRGGERGGEAPAPTATPQPATGSGRGGQD